MRVTFGAECLETLTSKTGCEGVEGEDEMRDMLVLEVVEKDAGEGPVKHSGSLGGITSGRLERRAAWPG